MKTKEITLCGKQVKLAYCYATEIGFKMMTDEDPMDFMQECFAAFNAQPQRKPDSRKTIYLILSAVMAYYESKDKDAPIKDSDLIYLASPEDIYQALGTVIQLYTEFYHIPTGEPKDKEEDKKESEKNV